MELEKTKLLENLLCSRGLWKNKQQSSSTTKTMEPYETCLNETILLIPDVNTIIMEYLVPKYQVDACDSASIWYRSYIRDVRFETNEVLIHFLGWSGQWDVWISVNDKTRIAPMERHTWNAIQVNDSTFYPSLDVVSAYIDLKNKDIGRWWDLQKNTYQLKHDHYHLKTKLSDQLVIQLDDYSSCHGRQQIEQLKWIAFHQIRIGVKYMTTGYNIGSRDVYLMPSFMF